MVDLEERVLDIIVNRTRIDRSKLSSDALLQTLGIESLDIVEIVFDIEEAFNISIPFNSNDRSGALTGTGFQTVGDVLKAVNDLVRGGPGTAAAVATAAAAPLEASLTEQPAQ